MKRSPPPEWTLNDKSRSSPLDFLRVLYFWLGGRAEINLKFMVTLAVDSAVSRAPNAMREMW